MYAGPSFFYLCGQALAEPISRDHVPPQQLYADDVGKVHSPNLLTIPVHTACNVVYQYDDDYFVNTLAPFARGSNSGDAFLKEVFQKFAADEKIELVLKVYEEFERQPSGLILSPGLVAKRFEGERLHRVAWKIIRGLYSHQFDEVLPEDTLNRLVIVPPDQPPPRECFLLPDEPVYGQFPGVFDYKFAKVTEIGDFNYWAIFLWDRIIMIMMFHDPARECEYGDIVVKPEDSDAQPASGGRTR